MAINTKDKLVTLESLGIIYSEEKDLRQDADQALSIRIDNIIAPEGDTSLTEVSDARVSGLTTYNTLKARLDADQAAVGTEIAEIKADLDAVENDVQQAKTVTDVLPNATLSGESISFTDGADAPVMSLTVTKAVEQSGSGDPSPSNVRNFVGADSVTITHGNGDSTTEDYSYDWSDDTGIAYAFTLDSVTGKLTVTHAVVDAGDLTWSYDSGRFYSASLNGVIKKPSSNAQVGDIKCDCLPTKSATSSSSTSIAYMISVGSAGQLYCRYNDYSDATQFKTAMTGHKIVYALATPLDYQLTGHTIRTYNGNNVFSVDSGQMEIKYFKDFYNSLKNSVDDVYKYLKNKVVEPTQEQIGKAIFTNNHIYDKTGAVLKKYTVDSGIEYYVTGAVSDTTAAYPVVAYMDANNQMLSYAYVGESIVRQKITIPSGCTYFYVNSYDGNSKVEIMEIPSKSLAEVADLIGHEQKELSILFIGNSQTQDGISYLPYMLKHFSPEVKFKFYIWYIASLDLAGQYDAFINDTLCSTFSIAENSEAWTNTRDTMAHILSTYTFDTVCMQENFNDKETYTIADISAWNDCRDYVISHYTGGNALKFISLWHSPRRPIVDTAYSLAKTGNALILQHTISEDILANGVAIYNAMQTELDELGDEGHLSPDVTHAQEGLPCLLQTYVVMLWIFDKYGINRSIYGLPFKMTTAIYNTLNVPGANLGTGVIEGTDAQNHLAQEVAIKSYKESRKFLADNLTVVN